MKLFIKNTGGILILILLTLLTFHVPHVYSAGQEREYTAVEINGFFRFEKPSGWKFQSDSELGVASDEKVYGGALLGPSSPHPKDWELRAMIMMDYYAPGNRLFDDAQQYLSIQLNPKYQFYKDKLSPLEDIKVGRHTAKTFTRSTFEYMPPKGIKMDEIPVKEQKVVLDFRDDGFFVLTYAAPESIYDENYHVFQHVLATFKPFSQVGEIEEDEYEVYSALLKHYLSTKENLPVFWETPEMLVIQQLTESKNLDDDAVRFFEESVGAVEVRLRPTLIEDFNKKNKKASMLEDRFSVPLKVVLLSKEESKEIFKEIFKGWKEFYRRYPGSGGIIRVSRVGFNSEKTMAFLYIAGSSDPLMGAGYYVLLVRPDRDSAWGIVKEVLLWVS